MFTDKIVFVFITSTLTEIIKLNKKLKNKSLCQIPVSCEASWRSKTQKCLYTNQKNIFKSVYRGGEGTRGSDSFLTQKFLLKLQSQPIKPLFTL